MEKYMYINFQRYLLNHIGFKYFHLVCQYWQQDWMFRACFEWSYELRLTRSWLHTETSFIIEFLIWQKWLHVMPSLVRMEWHVNLMEIHILVSVLMDIVGRTVKQVWSYTFIYFVKCAAVCVECLQIIIFSDDIQ